MDPSKNEISQERFGRVEMGFDQARRHAPGSYRETHYVFAGKSVRMRIVGDTLATHVEAPLSHLRAADPAAPPQLTIDLWDVHETAVSGLPAMVSHAAGKTWDLLHDVFAASPDGRIVSHELRGSVTWLDRQTQSIVGWYANGGDLSLHQRAKPLQLLLALWANDRGLQAVHAGLVARNGRGVLIPGSSGSGKSTAALACLGAGYTYLGDDWIAIGRAADGSILGHGLYSSAFLEAAHATRFDLLRAHTLAPKHASDTKSLVLLSHLFPQRLGDSTTLCALALPRISDTRATRCLPASKKEALLKLLPSSIFTMRPRPDRAGAERLAAIVDHLPAFWLEIGVDLSAIPQRMDEILANVGPR
jgi:hypothetical protein